VVPEGIVSIYLYCDTIHVIAGNDCECDGIQNLIISWMNKEGSNRWNSLKINIGHIKNFASLEV